MARDDSRRALERIAQLREGPDSESLHAELERLLARSSSAVVASAARLAGQRELHGLVPALLSSFERFAEQPAKRDPQCLAKRAIARALVELEVGGAALGLYRAGAQHVQLEPVFGGHVDTAAELRALCAQGLVLAGPTDLFARLADLLCDATSEARAGAARAIAASGNPHVGVPLLRLRVGIGDPDPRVVSEALAALLALDPEDSLEIVANHLEHRDAALAEGAALALGESRTPGALPLLRDWLTRVVDPERRRAGYLAVALLRSEEALALLFGEVQEAPLPHAQLALAALEPFFSRDGVLDRVEREVETRGDPELRRALANRD